MKRKITNLIMIAILISMSIACTNEKSNNDNANDADTCINKQETVEHHLILPSPLQIAYIFKKSGLKYNNELMNPIENNSKYFAEENRGVNLGVYSADLFYCVLNNRTQDALKYLKVVKGLVDNIEMPNVIQENQLTRFEKNLNKQDSLVYILTDIQKQMDNYVRTSGKKHNSVIYFTGAWIEGMFICANFANENEMIVKRMAEQLFLTDKIISSLEKYPSQSQFIQTLTKEMKELHQLFNTTNAIKQTNIEDIDFESITFSKDEIDGLTQKIKNIRKLIIQ